MRVATMPPSPTSPTCQAAGAETPAAGAFADLLSPLLPQPQPQPRAQAQSQAQAQAQAQAESPPQPDPGLPDLPTLPGTPAAPAPDDAGSPGPGDSAEVPPPPGDATGAEASEVPGLVVGWTTAPDWAPPVTPPTDTTGPDTGDPAPAREIPSVRGAGSDDPATPTVSGAAVPLAGTPLRTRPVGTVEDSSSPGTPPTPAARDSAAGPASSAAVPAAGTVVGPPSGTTGTGDPGAPSAPVARQVLDRIERLATAGDGTHRVTLRLDPGTLGEVRIHLTVREGRVRVRLTAGEDARVALTQAAPDLHRLLQGRGAHEVEVNVTAFDRPAPQPGQQADHQPDQQPGHPSGQQLGQPGQQPGERSGGHPHDLPGAHVGSEGSGSGTGQPGTPAGTRRATTATDGDQEQVDRPGSTDPGTSTPRVDVHM